MMYYCKECGASFQDQALTNTLNHPNLPASEFFSLMDSLLCIDCADQIVFNIIGRMNDGKVELFNRDEENEYNGQ